MHQKQRQENLDNGRAALAKAFRQEGVDGSERVLEPVLKQLKIAALDDLYVAVGNGNIGPKEVVYAAYPEFRQAPRAPRSLAASSVAVIRRPATPRPWLSARR